MKKIINALVKVEIIAAGAILVALILCTFGGVIMRYCFSKPFTWEEEFQLACMVWITFLAASVAFHTRSHVAIEILVDMFPKRLQQVVEVFIFLVMWGIMGYFFFRSIDFINVIASTSRKTPILKIPYAWIYGVAPVSIVLMMISYTYMTIQDVLARRSAGGEEEKA